jgi:hypothetical protein
MNTGGYKSHEMEFLNGISQSRFLVVNSSLLRVEFLSGFYLHFSFLQNTVFMNRLEFSCFVDFFCKDFKPEKSMVFFNIRQYKGL